MNPVKTIVISGATGLIGRNLKNHFEKQQWKVVALGRKDFDLNTEELAQKINGANVLVHLAGAPVIKRWTKSHKKEIINSRILTTQKLVEAIELAPQKPGVMISASAVGIYSPEGVRDEQSTQFAGDFLSKVCLDWEAEAEKAKSFTRLAIVRLGIVLAREGGALKTMLPPFRLGIGGKIASGRQPFAWIHIDDVIGAIDFLIQKPEENGIYNLAAPELINNNQFTTALAKSLKRPAIIPVPAFALRLLYGEAAATLTGGQKVVPKRLEEAGFRFKYPEIHGALKTLLDS